MTRHDLKVSTLAKAAVCTVVLAATGTVMAADQVRLRLNWMWYGSHAPFALGLDKGFYKDAGIDLEIRSGNGSGSAHRLVANGDSTFSYGSCAGMVNLAAKGAPLVSVAVIDAMGSEAVIVRPNAGISKVADLKGKKILTTANAGVNIFFPLVLKNAGLSESDVSVTNVPDGALVSGYLQAAGGAVGMLGGLDDKPSEIRAAGGANPIAFPYSDFGVNQVGYCIAVAKKTLAEKPDMVRRFVAATVKSYRAAEADPQSSVNAVGDIVGGTMNEEAGKKQTFEVQAVTMGILYSKANTRKVLGLHVGSDWSDMVGLMKKYNGLETDSPATAFYTNDYLPK
jgi:NitT/TauT family transport system substrate-binding protein